MMDVLLQLPRELLDRVLLLLSRPDLRQFRCVSHACANLTTPILFGEIAFDHDPGGCTGLVSIAHSPTLRRHPHTIRLCRRSGMRDFGNFDCWHAANIHEFRLSIEGDQAIVPLSPPNAISRHDWLVLDQDQLQELHQQYQRDLNKREAYISHLASAVSSTLGLVASMEALGQARTSDVSQTLDGFCTAIRALSNVSKFEHVPAFVSKHEWGRRWRNLEFHPSGLLEHGGYGTEPEKEALQLFYTLYTALHAPNTLRSLEIFTCGTAFWSVPSTRALLNWSNRSNDPRGDSFEDFRFRIHDWFDRLGGPIPTDRSVEAVTRHLVALERGFSRIAHLRCQIDTTGMDDTTLCAAARGLSNGLRETIALERLSLVFRNSAHVEQNGRFFYFNRQFESQWTPREGPHLEVSNRLLLTSASTLCHLRRLQLSLPTICSHLLSFLDRARGLRDIRLSHVCLLSGGGTWETVLIWMAQHLQLGHVKLQSLEDIYKGRPRLLLVAGAPEWSQDKVSNEFYEDHERDIVQYVLRRSRHLPLLSPHAATADKPAKQVVCATIWSWYEDSDAKTCTLSCEILVKPFCFGFRT